MKPYQTKPGFLYIPIKRGDGIISKNAAPQVRMFNGMCSGYIDPEQWKTPPIISVFSQGETQWVEVPKTKESLEFAKEAGKLSAYDRSNKNFRQAALFIDPVSLQPHSQNRDFIFDFYTHKKPVPVLCLKSLPLNSIKESSRININDKPIEDVGQIQEGSFLVGPAATDHYPTFGGAGGAFAALGNLTNHLYFYLSGVITDTAQASTSISLNNFYLNVLSNMNPLGKLSYDRLINLDFAGSFFVLQPDGPGSIVFSLLSIKDINPAGAINVFQSLIPVGPDYSFLASRNIIHGIANTVAIFLLQSTGPAYVRRNVIYNAMDGINFASGSASSIIGYNTIYACEKGFRGGADPALVVGNYITGCVNCFNDKAPHDGRYNYSEDATAEGVWASEVGNANNKLRENCVASTSDDSPSFLDIKPGGDLSGVIPGFVTVSYPCARGRLMPLSTCSVGAAERPSLVRSDLRYW